MHFELKSNVTGGSAVALTNGMTLTEGNLSINGTLTATGYNNANWDTAYGWGDHSVAGYTTTTAQELSRTGLSSSDDLGSGSSAPLSAGWYSWGSSQPSNSPNNYALMYQLNDGGQPQQWVMAYGGATNSVDLYARRRTGGTWDTTWTKFWNSTDFTSTNVSNWNTAYGWGDHSVAGYISSFNITSQTDPKYLRSDIDDQMLAQLSGGFGAVSTGGTTDWNHSTNARSGGGYTLLNR